jgi:hypothetical protein
MDVCPKWKAVMLRFLHCFEAHVLAFSVKFQHGPQYFVLISAI